MRAKDIVEISKLSTPEKILLVEDLWENIAADEESVPVPQSHKTELDKRLERFEASPGNLLTLEELQSCVKSRK